MVWLYALFFFLNDFMPRLMITKTCRLELSSDGTKSVKAVKISIKALSVIITAVMLLQPSNILLY